MASKNKSGRPLTGSDRYLRGGKLQDRLRDPGSDHLPRGDNEKYREGWDRIFGPARQCGELCSFNIGRLRCTHPAGHAGLHSVFDRDGTIIPTQENDE